MQPEAILHDDRARPGLTWRSALVQLGCVWATLLALTWGEWRAMVHQWWAIDTYGHTLLIPSILAWLAWSRRGELARIDPQGWWPGLVWMATGLSIWLAGDRAEINLIAQVGTILAFQGALAAVLGLRAVLLLAFPLGYALFLVPFGDEIVPALQALTARMTVALTHASGIPAEVDGIHIYTPAGLFIVAEACSGVKFLIAMIALGTLVAWSCFESARRRLLLLLACIVVPIVANGIRAWATIYVAQFVGAEAAGGFDHIVYGWIFFGLVIALVLGIAWPWFEREPDQAGYAAADLRGHALMRFEATALAGTAILAIAIAVAIAFAVLATLG